jgi:hypothetical protein
LKRTIALLLAVAAAILIRVAASGSLPVRAGSSYGTNVVCPMQDSSFSGSFDDRTYTFTLACYDNQNFQVTATYNPAIQFATERLVGAGSSLTALWSCPSDPWGTYEQPVCANTGTEVEPSATGILAGYDLVGSTLPYSAQSLDAADHATLFSEAVQAERQQAQVTPTPQSANFGQRIGESTSCVGCGNLFGTQGYETTLGGSSICAACVAAAAPSLTPTPSLTRTPSPNQRVNGSSNCVGCSGLFGTPGYETTTHGGNSVCVICAAVTQTPTPTYTPTPSPTPAPN